MAIYIDSTTGRMIDIPDYGGYQVLPYSTPQFDSSRFSQPYNDNIIDVNAVPKQAAARGLFSNLRGKFGEGKTLGPSIFGGLGGLKNLTKDVQNTNVLGLGKVKTLGNIGMGAYQGLKGISNLNQLSDANSDLDTIKSQVNMSAMSNPLYASYLDSSQKQLLRKVQNDTYASGSGLEGGLESGLKAIPKAAINTLAGFLIGNVPGAIIQGVGTLANAGLEGATKAKSQKASELQGLYEALASAEADYNSMRRPANLMTSGLQRRYASQLI